MRVLSAGERSVTLLSILLEFARGSVAAQAVYRLTDLGTLGGEVTLA